MLIIKSVLLYAYMIKFSMSASAERFHNWSWNYCSCFPHIHKGLSVTRCMYFLYPIYTVTRAWRSLVTLRLSLQEAWPWHREPGGPGESGEAEQIGGLSVYCFLTWRIETGASMAMDPQTDHTAHPDPCTLQLWNRWHACLLFSHLEGWHRCQHGSGLTNSPYSLS